MKWPSICKRLMYTTCPLKLHVSHWHDMVKLVVPSREMFLVFGNGRASMVS